MPRWIRIPLKLALILLLVLACALASGLVWLYLSISDAMELPANDAPSLLHWTEPPPESDLRNNTPRTVDFSLGDRITHLDSGARPWVRWWWPGADVDSEAACNQLSDLRDQGFGGVEIQAFSAGLEGLHSPEPRAAIEAFDSAAYFDTLRTVMACADELGMIVYLNHLSGWPAGGPQVNASEGIQTLRYAAFEVDGGQEIDLTLPLPRAGLNDWMMALGEFLFGADLTNFAPELGELAAVVAAQKMGGDLGANPLNATDSVVLADGTLKDLTDQVVEGRLRWHAPPGQWLVLAAYRVPSGEAPTLVAAETPGFVVDPMRSEVLRAHYDYAFGARTGLERWRGSTFQGIFNDSLEFKVDRLAATDMLEAFAVRRGYSLVEHLPAIFVDARDNYFLREVGRMRAAPTFVLSEHDDRIRYDYQRTISDLIVERFAGASSQWARERGLLSRAQSYGSDFDLIQALGANDIPEIEQLFAGGSDLFLRMAGSAAFHYDKPMVTAESFVWHNLAYAVAPDLLKAAADKLFLNGVNQLVYHGIPYRNTSPDYDQHFGKLGWYPFQGPGNDAAFSGNYGPASSLWGALPQFNQYISRTQTLLQMGSTDWDVLIYYPFMGFPLEWEDSTVAQEEFLFAGRLPDEIPVPQDPAPQVPFSQFPEDGGDARRLWLESITPLIQALDQAGITWGWVNDDALQSAINNEESPPVVLANVPWLQPETAEAVRAQARAGRTFARSGALPARQPGYLDYLRGDRRVQNALAAAEIPEVNPENIAMFGNGTLLTGTQSIRRIGRTLPDGSELHFLVNQSLDATHANVVLGGKRPEFRYWFDPRTGDSWPARSGESTLELTLAPLESRFLILTNSEIQTTDKTEMRDPVLSEPANAPLALPPIWHVNAPGLRTEAPLERSVLDAALANNSGTVQYSSELTLTSPGIDRQHTLEITRAKGLTRLLVNGVDLGTSAVAPHRWQITHLLQPGRNHIEVQVTPPLRAALLDEQKREESQAPALPTFLLDVPIPRGQIGSITIHRGEDGEDTMTQSKKVSL